jgi:hypothetical protein
MLLRTDTQTPTEMYEFGTFRPTEWERVPPAYLIRPESVDELAGVVDLLKAHGIRMETLDAPVEFPAVELFRVDSVTTSEREYEGHFAQEVFGGYYDHSDNATLEAGTLMIPMDQPLARVAFSLLEPRSDDGMVVWGLISGFLTGEGLYPILRVMPGSQPPLLFRFDPDIS